MSIRGISVNQAKGFDRIELRNRPKLGLAAILIDHASKTLFLWPTQRNPYPAFPDLVP